MFAANTITLSARTPSSYSLIPSPIGLHLKSKTSPTFYIVFIGRIYINTVLIKPLLRISLICAFRIFSRFRTAFDGRRSTQAWLQNLAPFQVFINTSVIQDIQDKTLTIYINFGKFKLEKAPNFVTRPASNVDHRTPFGSEKKNAECTYQ